MCSKQNISTLETQTEDNSRSMFHTTEITSYNVLIKLVQTKNRLDWDDGFRKGLKRPLKRTKNTVYRITPQDQFAGNDHT